MGQRGVLGLVLCMVLGPRTVTLIVAACVILLWSLVNTFAILLDVRLMLRLRKQQPSVQPHTEQQNGEIEVEMLVVDGSALRIADGESDKIGRASCRERGCQYV